MLKKISILLMITLFLSLTFVEAKEYKSSEVLTNTIELFTSEGCSSCPPADKWISKFIDDKSLFEEIIPIVFHVDYWDYIGWEDTFALAKYSSRQRKYQEQGKSSQNYTPQFMVNSKEWRGWFRAFGEKKWEKSKKEVGQLTLNHKEESKLINISFKPKEVSKDGYKLHIVILGMGIESKIKRGENSGEILIHDFVVLNHKSYPLQHKTIWSVAMIDIPKVSQSKNVIVAWLSAGTSQEIVQSVGGYLLK